MVVFAHRIDPPHATTLGRRARAPRPAGQHQTGGARPWPGARGKGCDVAGRGFQLETNSVPDRRGGGNAGGIGARPPTTAVFTVDRRGAPSPRA